MQVQPNFATGSTASCPTSPLETPGTPNDPSRSYRSDGATPFDGFAHRARHALPLLRLCTGQLFNCEAQVEMDKASRVLLGMAGYMQTIALPSSMCQQLACVGGMVAYCLRHGPASSRACSLCCLIIWKCAACKSGGASDNISQHISKALSCHLWKF